MASLFWDEPSILAVPPKLPLACVENKKAPIPHGTRTARGATQFAEGQLFSLYRANPSDSSFAAPERNRYALLLSCINRQLSKSVARCFSFIALQY